MPEDHWQEHCVERCPGCGHYNCKCDFYRDQEEQERLNEERIRQEEATRSSHEADYWAHYNRTAI